ncbi:hypothetical protein FOQG_14996 [Fusarium oxysporum f. sp. raphani 54005]|uniref:Uncharacterized protein n=3 Tax=Fusarium oxysporum TaxID=5507 RepID=X0CCW2_FUSOX|nr:hypothetical protein FOQG_14996 [Fusarium oxysporum f. sp. raphani 54005]KAG7423496.1 hypothetical protein Forpi1262_v015470 [Fusarium oxysporum f. sp. raphani]
MAANSFASITPHDSYSSSIGVLGCKIDTNRVSHDGRSVNLLKIDSSGSAHDISYDAWNYLVSGRPASEDPQKGGGIVMNYEYVHASKCQDLLEDGKPPLSAANSMNYLAGCLGEPQSWVASNFVLYNINDPVCKYGVNEKCHLNLAISNHAECPSGLGSTSKLNLNVKNIIYGSGKSVTAP